MSRVIVYKMYSLFFFKYSLENHFFYCSESVDYQHFNAHNIMLINLTWTEIQLLLLYKQQYVTILPILGKSVTNLLLALKP